MKNNTYNKAAQDGAIPIPRQALEMLFNGFSMYSTMTQRLLEITGPSMNRCSQEEIRSRQEAFIKSFLELLEMLSPSVKSYDGTESLMESIEAWRRFMTSAPLSSLPMAQLCQKFEALAENWQMGTQKLFNDWNECLQELSGSYQAALSRGEDPRQLWINSTASYEKFYNSLLEARFAFVTGHMKALFQLLHSSMPEETQPAKTSPGKTNKEEAVKLKSKR